MSDLSLQSRVVQTTSFSPRLQHAVRLLQMSSIDYAQSLYEEALGNPFLEVDEAGAPPLTLAIETSAASESSADDASDVAASGDRDHLAEDWRIAGGAGSDDDAPDALQGMAVRTTLRSHLHGQIGVQRLSPRERALAGAIIEALDDDGYLRVTLEDIGAAVGAVDPTGLQVALCRVQALEPAGVGARSVSECLALQLQYVAQSPVRALALRIVREHIDALALGNQARLARRVGASQNDVRAATELIRGLEAHPGWRYGDTRVQSVTPDVTVRKLRGQWVAELNRFALPRVRLNAPYVEMLARAGRQGAHPAMAGCLERARWTLSNVAQRGATILSVARAIAARQKLFLEYGPLAMKPLGLREIADTIGVHPSTVSRTAHGKYLATPHGVFEMRYFFSRGLDHSAGGASAPTALQGLIREMIVAEPRDDPLSDAQVARLLAQQGFKIARRTVTKYRQKLGIQQVEGRRGREPGHADCRQTDSP